MVATWAVLALACYRAESPGPLLVPWQRLTGKIAYIQRDAEGTEEAIMVIDATHGTVRSLGSIGTLLGATHSVVALAWRPGGEAISVTVHDYDGSATGTYAVFDVDAATGAAAPSATLPGGAAFPAWSGNGDVACSKEGSLLVNGRVLVSPAANLSSLPYGMSAAWAPDGSRLLVATFVTLVDGWGLLSSFTAVAEVDLSSGALRELLLDDLYHPFGDPIFSPDGTRVAFTQSTPGGLIGDSVPVPPGSGLFVMETARLLEAATPRPTRAALRDLWSPAWSPDGTQLTAGAVGDSGAQLVLVNAATGDVTQLTRNGGERPAWTR